ncbi:PulJ/GspJ family protein [Cohnella hashimotonis]|uniref:Prepilin-type N-terminal cleavage/methylation domain-containing protein n=1 Tax=Cohnella hashimotonis TaxID=2826895 RepID=A0ABT6TBU9_9BACL|nr:prepilin-type N-terminal cleavage/methylation domain-containing protein [Cohnella hashimotonis]MDI4644314.1 prepilin-type N-terminal cleavage/methylation domain-containing protein [Cohnella hashimotonis]
MKRFAKNRNVNQDGFTLIEMIATLTVLSIVSIAIYSVIQFGFNTYHKVTIENSLRDEGDLIMSKIIAQLYEQGPESIADLPNGIKLINKEDNAVTSESQIQIINKKLHVYHEDGTDELIDTISDIEPVDQVTKEITISCQIGIAECPSGLIEVSIKLSQAFSGKVQSLELESRFGF